MSQKVWWIHKVAGALGLAQLVVNGAAHADPSRTTPEQGYDLGEIPTPRSVAVGGADTALGTSIDALFGNPANLPLASVYHFAALAAYMPEAQRETFGGGIVDSSTSRVAGGIGGSWSMMDPDGLKRQWTDVRAGMGYPFGDKLSLGVTGRFLRATQDISKGPFGPSLASDGTPTSPLVSAVTFDAGATLTPTPNWRIGVVGQNLTVPGNGFLPTTLTGGIGYMSDQLSLEGDMMLDFTTFNKAEARLMAGGELFLASHIPIRLGYRFDNGTGTQSLSGGIGYVDPSWSLEASFQRDIVGDHPATMFIAGLRYFFQSPKTEGDEPDSF